MGAQAIANTTVVIGCALTRMREEAIPTPVDHLVLHTPQTVGVADFAAASVPEEATILAKVEVESGRRWCTDDCTFCNHEHAQACDECEHRTVKRRSYGHCSSMKVPYQTVASSLISRNAVCCMHMLHYFQ